MKVKFFVDQDLNILVLIFEKEIKTVKTSLKILD
jgi:hypothetical protein